MISPALRAFLTDRSAALPAPGAEARAAAMLRAHVLARVGSLLAAEGIPAMLVKGAALALTVYPDPAARPMQDIDLLVRRDDRDRAVAALMRGGLELRTVEYRPASGALLGETLLMARSGALETLVEVHTSLDKIVPRPIDEDALFANARPAPGLPGLVVPAPEDHALLVALHAAGHDFRHPAAFLDLELLLRRGLDHEALVARAHAWRLATVMFVALTMLRDLGGSAVPADLVARFEPGPIRRALLQRAAASGDALGAAWILRQTPLRDDLGGWTIGLGRYAAARAVDHVASVFAAGPGSSPDLAQPGPAVQDAAVPYRVPLWVRALLAVDHAAFRVENLREGLRDELLLAWIPPVHRASLTAALYSDQSTYLPGGHRFQAGLFPWEKRVIDGDCFPRSGRALVGAAGAGREMMALVERGFEVVAFDPCQPFVDAARTVAPPGRATVVQASYADLVDAANGRGGPLAGAVAGGPFDAVVLGWGSLSHVMPSSARSDLLRAVRAVAPRAPVLASFALEPEKAQPLTGKGRVRDGLRRAFAALRAPGVSEVGDHFFPNTGFFSYLGSDEVVRLAWEAGYEVPLFEDAPYAHAVFVPLAAGRREPRIRCGMNVRPAPRNESGTILEEPGRCLARFPHDTLRSNRVRLGARGEPDEVDLS
ncbi:MAG: nucleotidyltransferase family protein [Minicystis sp.]